MNREEIIKSCINNLLDTDCQIYIKSDPIERKIKIIIQFPLLIKNLTNLEKNLNSNHA